MAVPRERPGTPTIYEVARHAGVSIATVSRVQRSSEAVAPPTRRRVLDAIAELGYRPSGAARSLAVQRHEATGIVFPDLSGPYYSAVIEGYEAGAVADGQSVLILATHGRRGVTALIQDLSGRVDGLVVLGRTVPDDVIEGIAERLPVVLLARPAIDGADEVRAENTGSARALTRHLFGHGLQRIAFLGDPAGSPDADERWSGVRVEHEEAGRPVPAAVPCDYREPAGRAAASRLFEAPAERRPDALVCANDEIAIGALRAARDAGLSVPGDVAITGWDDVPMAALVEPPITTVHQPLHDLGATAASLLASRIRGERTRPQHVLLPTELVVRASCGCQEHGGVR